MQNLPQFQQNKLLKEVSTFGIGGPAQFFIQVFSVEEMQKVLVYCHKEKIPFFILGKGSNCLFDDQGFEGVVIQNKISYITIKEQSIDVGSGYSFSLLGAKSAKEGLTGLEFASGIPASVGGAVFMNAGANGGETANCLEEVTFINELGNLLVFMRKDLDFSYRKSPFQQMKGAIVSAKFILEKSLNAREKQLAIIEYRTRTQPYQDLSIGCIFKNPIGNSAGALIEKSGLKGLVIGGAEVSPKHANFIVNRSSATAKDVLELMNQVQYLVEQSTGIQLEMEIRCIPYKSQI